MAIIAVCKIEILEQKEKMKGGSLETDGERGGCL